MTGAGQAVTVGEPRGPHVSTQPVILIVDDDITSLTITEQEMRKRYGRDYRVLARQSATAALDELRRLKAAGPARRPDPRRPGDAGDAGHRLPRRGPAHRPRREARDARLVGRQELAQGDPRRLRRRPDRVLHHQAVAHGAGRALPPRRGGLPLRVVPPAAAGVRGRAHRRRALGAALARAPRPAGAQRRRVRVLRRRTPTRAGRSCGTPAWTRRPAAGRHRLRRPDPRWTRATARSRSRSGCGAGRPPTSAIC